MSRLRPARAAELPRLIALCHRSKAVRGYDAAFMEACSEELTFTRRDLIETCVQVAEDDGGIIGVVQVDIDGDVAELEKLFVEPNRMHSGAGRQLMNCAIATARAGGANRLMIDADPGAAGFYRRMGARDVGTTPSISIPNRRLPRLRIDL